MSALPPQSPHVTLYLFLSLGVGPSPVMMCPYVSSDLFPGVLHGLPQISEERVLPSGFP